MTHWREKQEYEARVQNIAITMVATALTLMAMSCIVGWFVMLRWLGSWIF